MYRGSYTFYIIHESKIVSSVSVALTWETLLQTPRTRSQQTIEADTFYIQLVETNPDPLYRHKGWATLLLMYTISYLQKLYPQVKIFTLKDESPQNTNIKDSIYNNLGFIPMHIEAMSMTEKNKTEPTDTKKILDFGKESIFYWIKKRCLRRINNIRKKARMPLIVALGKLKQKTKKNTKKQKNKKNKKTKNKKTKNKKQKTKTKNKKNKNTKN